MILTPAQKQIAKDLHRFRVLNCGRRFGKSTLAAWEMLGMACGKKGRRVAYYAPTRDDARDIIWNILLKVAENAITYKNEARLEIKVATQDGGESSIYLYGWESVQERGKGRGVSNDFLVLDEVASMRNFWEGWDEVLSPTLIDRAGSAMFISTPKGFNHFYDLYNMETRDKNYKSFHFTSYDNPNLPVDELEREKNAKNEDVFAQEYLADFRKQQGLVYKEFSREKHLYDDFTDKGTIVSTLQGIDWGFIHNGVVLDLEKSHNGHYWVSSCWSHAGKTDDEIVEYAAAKKPSRTYPDPENAQAIEKARRRGLNVQEVVKGKGSINSGIDTVRTLFKEGRLHIHKDCMKLITSLEVYSYKEGSEETSEEGKDECDALRYPLMMDASNVVSVEEEEEFSLYSTKFK